MIYHILKYYLILCGSFEVNAKFKKITASAYMDIKYNL